MSSLLPRRLSILMIAILVFAVAVWDSRWASSAPATGAPSGPAAVAVPVAPPAAPAHTLPVATVARLPEPQPVPAAPGKAAAAPQPQSGGRLTPPVALVQFILALIAVVGLLRVYGAAHRARPARLAQASASR